ncbi:MAG TPA: heme ABC exporter ATP-binding protein CcmA [Solirubrobacteraceae bacterium]|nr:heme ABC exporter ATP-binding protein CcmA [Solirubrobacteraceae bacterium]
MESSSPALELRALGRRFGERAVLRSLTLTLEHGQTLAVLGSNGAGKTTLLRVLAGLLAPHSGRARVLGAELPRERELLRGRIGWIGHEPLLYRALTVSENLSFHARLHGQGRRRVAELLEAVGMSARAKTPVRELSRGMLQRVAVARALIGSPQLLLLDEPEANLDPGAREALEPLIGRDSRCTRVLTSHDPQAALEEADLVLGLRDGAPLLLEPPASIDRDRLSALYSP